MPKYPMTDVVASREYTLENEGKRVLVHVEIGKPTPLTEHPTRWFCPWSIRRPSGTLLFAALGADSLDALTTALSAVRINLELIASTGKLTVEEVEGPNIELI